MSKLTAWLASLALGVAVSTGLVFGHEYVEPVPVEPAVHRSYPSGFIADGLRALHHRENVAQLRQVAAYLDALVAREGRPDVDTRGANGSFQRDVYDTGADVASVQSEFIRGWRAGGGVEEWLPYVLNTVVPCESSWQPLVISPAGHLGLGQWLPSTWEAAGGGDWTNPWQQGRNMGAYSEVNGGGAWECWTS